MLMLTVINLFFMMIPIMILLINIIMMNYYYMDREKTSPFECGFDPITSPRLPFSISFYKISLIFLIFDIEIALMIPILYTSKIELSYISIYIFNFFILVLLFGLILEWMDSHLDWKN